jgi:hypothetical protein
VRVTGVREFRARAPKLLRGRDIVLITRHGKLSGLFVPLSDPEELPVELRKEILRRLGTAIARHLKKRGVTEGKAQSDFEAWRKARARRSGR